MTRVDPGVGYRPSFADSPLGPQFRVAFSPPRGTAPQGSVVFVHPFAEEMNKSRAQVAACARTLAKNGFKVLLFDLHGCGDSAGLLSQATWERWVAELRQVLLEQARTAPGPLWVWGLRAGALLASAALVVGDLTANLLLWHPVLNGRQHLQQFLRLSGIAAMLRPELAGRKSDPERQLQKGRNAEVAGYELSPQLVAGMGQAELRPPPNRPVRVAWLEVDTAEVPQLSFAGQQRIQAWRTAGVDVDAAAVRGPEFWRTQEIEACPSLIEATLAGLLQTAR